MEVDDKVKVDEIDMLKVVDAMKGDKMDKSKMNFDTFELDIVKRKEEQVSNEDAAKSVNSKVRKNHEFVVNVLKAKKWDQSNLRN
jgi:hypothetical protein